uniref:hypothetical protein n=1 Tax=Massilia oculi TaxID=945844 RepID=UPI0036D430BD
MPVFVRGRNAWAEGVGEQLTPISLPEAAYLLVDPGVHVPDPGVISITGIDAGCCAAKIADFAPVPARQCVRAGPAGARTRREAVFQALSRSVHRV